MTENENNTSTNSPNESDDSPGVSRGSISDQILLKYTEESLVVVDRDLKIVLVNTTFASNYKRLLNKTVKLGDSVLDYAVTTDAEKVRKIFELVFSGETIESEIAFTWEGEMRRFLNKFKPVYNDRGEVYQVFVIARDVSRERHATEKLKAEQERLQKIMDQSVDLICSFKEGRIVSANEAVRTILGYDPKRIIGKKYIDLVHPEDRLSSVDIVAKIFSDGEVRGFENRYRHRKGHWVPLIWSARFDEQDNIVYAVARDATEQKENQLQLQRNEERLRNAQIIAGIGHWECSMRQDQFLCSDVLCSIIQWDFEKGTPTFRDFLATVHPEDRKLFIEAIDLVRAEDTSMDIQHRLVLPDQNVKYVQHRASLVEVQNAVKPVVQGTVLDITRTKRQSLEQELSSAVVKALQQHDTLEDSLAEVLRLFAVFSGNIAGEAWYVNSETQKLSRKSSWTKDSGFEFFFTSETDLIEVGKGLPGITARNGRIEYWKNLPKRKRFIRSENAGELGLKSGIGIPVLVNEVVIAVFTLYNKTPILDWTFISEILNRLSLQIGIDIQRKQATVELNQFFKFSPHLIAMIGTDGFYHRVNPSFYRLLGFTEKEMMSRPFHYFVHPDDRNTSLEQLSQNSEGNPTRGFVNRYLTKKGDVKWIQWHSSAQLSDEGVLFGFGTDITEVKETNEQLLKYKQIIEQSRDGIGLVSLHDDNVYVNEAFQEELGYSADDIKAMGGPAKLYTAEQAGNEMLRTILKGQQWKGDVDVLTPDGRLREFYLSAGPVFDDEGNLIALYGIHTNISERKKHEKELKAAYEEKNSILESIADGFYTINSAGEITYWNNEAEQLTGFPREKVLGKKLEDLYPESDRSALAQKFLEAINASENSTIEGYSEAIHKWIQMTTYPSEHGISVFFRDITAAKEAEAEKGLLLEVIDSSLHEVYMFSGEEMKFEYVNTGALKNLGFSLEEMRKLHPWDIKPDYDETAFMHAVRPLIKKQKEKIVFETAHRRKNGSKYPVEVHLQINHHHRRMLFVAVVLDISERKKQEKALMKLNNQLSRRAYELAISNEELELFAMEREKLVQELTSHNNDLRQFSYITSHNLRAPLSNIIGLLYLFEDLNIKNEQYEELLNGVQVSARQLQETIDDLGHIISIKNSPAVSSEKISFATILENILLQVKRISGIKDQEVVTDFSKAPEVKFNKTYLESVLLNLMTNAIKYRSPDRRLKINIHSERRGNKTLLIFADNGIGLDVNRYKDRLFGLYQRFHPEKEGKGIGLFLVKSQMEAMGGNIHIESNIGKGTVFTLTFID